MKAAILTKINAPLIVDGIVLPKELGYGQVLVKILASGICGAQLQEIAGFKGNAKHVPHLLGHEGSGIVEGTGAGVSRVKVGDQVVAHWRKAAGLECEFPKYQWWDVKSGIGIPWTVGGGKVTTLSEYAVISENRLTPVPHGTPNDLCALLGCSLSTALGTIERDAGLKFGESVLIVGVGGLGANLIRCAKMVHANPIVAMDIHPEKKKLALSLGATEYLSAKTLFQCAERFDVIIDTAGSGKSMEWTLPLLNPSGRFVMVGQPKPGAAVNILDACHLFEGEGKSIKATQGGGFKPHEDIPRYIQMFKAGALNIDGIVTHHLPLKKINQAIDLVRNGHASRIMIDMAL